MLRKNDIIKNKKDQKKENIKSKLRLGNFQGLLNRLLIILNRTRMEISAIK
jgi:hypothetical protein